MSETSTVAKSENTQLFNFDDMLVTSAHNRDYSVVMEKLSIDDINLWTGRVPLWSNIDLYSSISEIQTDSSDEETKGETSKISSNCSEPCVEDIMNSMHNLCACKHTYHSTRPWRTSSQTVFYRDMCQETTPQSWQCQRPLSRSEPSASRIKAQQHAAKPPQGSKFTYPVLSEKSKQDSSSEDSGDHLDSDATELYSVPSESEQQDPTDPPVTPKGSFVTKTFSVKNPVKYPKTTSKHQRKCPKCDHQSDSIAGINAHYKNLYEPVTCDHCSLSFSTLSTLHSHMYIHKELKFKCDKCTRQFPFASDLRVHQVKHESECTHKCSKCPKSFFMKCDLL